MNMTQVCLLDNFSSNERKHYLRMGLPLQLKNEIFSLLNERDERIAERQAEVFDEVEENNASSFPYYTIDAIEREETELFEDLIQDEIKRYENAKNQVIYNYLAGLV